MFNLKSNTHIVTIKVCVYNLLRNSVALLSIV